MADGGRPPEAGSGSGAPSFDDDTTTGWAPPRPDEPVEASPPAGGDAPPPRGSDAPPPPWPFQSVLDQGPGGGAPGSVPPGPPPTWGGPGGSVPPPPAGGAPGGPGFAAPDLSRSSLAPDGDTWRDRTQRQPGPGAGPIVLGLLLILGGGFLLARELVPDLRVDIAWPYAVVTLGLVLILIAILRPPRPRDDRGWR